MPSSIARAKINLTLHVGRAIADQSDPFFGYHPLDSLVVFSDFGDVLSCEPANDMALEISGPFAKDVPSDATNLILKAVHVAGRTSDHPPLAFKLEKNLPVASGIGGGSANAAAALRLLARYIDLPQASWMEIALKIGADVPVCLASKTARMTGIGETVTPLPGLGQIFVVLANPAVQVLTKEIFQALDSAEPRETPRPAMMAGDLLTRALDGRNDLEPPAMSFAPEIGICLRELASTAGCQLARMSGSGATCFGIYASDTQAKRAADMISKKWPAWWVRAARLGDTD